MAQHRCHYCKHDPSQKCLMRMHMTQFLKNVPEIVSSHCMHCDSRMGPSKPDMLSTHVLLKLQRDPATGFRSVVVRRVFCCFELNKITRAAEDEFTPRDMQRAPCLVSCCYVCIYTYKLCLYVYIQIYMQAAAFASVPRRFQILTSMVVL